MSTEVTKYQPIGAVAPLHPQPHIESTTVALANLLGGTSLQPTIERLPNAQERGRLHERKMQIRSLLRPATEAVADRDRISKAVGNLIGGWLNVRADGPETIAGFTMKLQELPSWAVVDACTDFAEGRATFEVAGKIQRSSPEYAPSAATIFLVARQKLEALYAEEALLNRITAAKLAGPPEDPEMRSRMGVLLDEVAKDIGSKADALRAADQRESKEALDAARGRAAQFAREANERRLARYAALGLVPVYMGDKLCDADALPAHLQKIVGEEVDVR